MKKMVLALLSLLVIGLFLVGCAPQSADEKLAQGDLTAAEKAQLPSDLKEGGTALAGKAVDFSGCTDSDSNSTYDQNSLLTKSTTTYAGGSKEDKCYTWNKGTPQEKTRLIEGACSPTRSGSKFLYWYADCGDSFGKEYQCISGTCALSLEPTTPKNTIELKSNSDKKYQLTWYDGDNNKVQMPVAYLGADNKLVLGEDSEKKLVLKEWSIINKNDYFVVTSGKDSYLLQYKGADAIETPDAKIKFKNLGSGESLTLTYSTTETIIKLGGHSFMVVKASDASKPDFAIYVDLSGNGILEDVSYHFKTQNQEIKIQQPSSDKIDVSVYPASTGTELRTRIIPNLETQKVSATFMGGCEFTTTSADGLSKTCTISDTETFKWISSTPEEFVYSYNK